MWINAQRCCYYSTLQEILQELQEIFSKINFHDLKNQPNATIWSNDVNNEWHSNWSINLYNKIQPIQQVPNIFKSVVEKIKTMQGCQQAFINFVAPESIIPKHKDNKKLGNIIGPECVCYQSVLAISIPSNNPEVCGFETEGEIRGCKTGDIIAFDGMVDHWGWNYSNQWRITAVVDIAIEDYNLIN